MGGTWISGQRKLFQQQPKPEVEPEIPPQNPMGTHKSGVSIC